MHALLVLYLKIMEIIVFFFPDFFYLLTVTFIFFYAGLLLNDLKQNSEYTECRECGYKSGKTDKAWEFNKQNQEKFAVSRVNEMVLIGGG